MRSFATIILLAGPQLAAGHVALRYPHATVSSDFIDNIRTVGLCGDEASGADSSNLCAPLLWIAGGFWCSFECRCHTRGPVHTHSPDSDQSQHSWLDLLEPDTTTVAKLKAGSKLDVDWDLHYAHQVCHSPPKGPCICPSSYCQPVPCPRRFRFPASGQADNLKPRESKPLASF